MKAKAKSGAFSDDTKNEVFLKTSLSNALTCPICKGYMEPAKAASYDHVVKKADGGSAGAAPTHSATPESKGNNPFTREPHHPNRIKARPCGRYAA
jgi:hypothetical protein